MEKKPPLALEMVRDFVANAHGNMEQIVQLLEKEPELLNAAWDWGGGDWETGLGAAAHMGRKDIARYLLARGARLDIFAAAMLGHLAIVQAIVRAYPDAPQWRGPHGIPLLTHAQAGGEDAAGVAEFLRIYGK